MFEYERNVLQRTDFVPNRHLESLELRGDNELSGCFVAFSRFWETTIGYIVRARTSVDRRGESFRSSSYHVQRCLFMFYHIVVDLDLLTDLKEHMDLWS